MEFHQRSGGDPNLLRWGELGGGRGKSSLLWIVIIGPLTILSHPPKNECFCVCVRVDWYPVRLCDCVDRGIFIIHHVLSAVTASLSHVSLHCSSSLTCRTIPPGSKTAQGFPNFVLSGIHASDKGFTPSVNVCLSLLVEILF